MNFEEILNIWSVASLAMVVYFCISNYQLVKIRDAQFEFIKTLQESESFYKEANEKLIKESLERINLLSINKFKIQDLEQKISVQSKEIGLLNHRFAGKNQLLEMTANKIKKLLTFFDNPEMKRPIKIKDWVRGVARDSGRIIEGEVFQLGVDGDPFVNGVFLYKRSCVGIARQIESPILNEVLDRIIAKNELEPDWTKPVPFPEGYYLPDSHKRIRVVIADKGLARSFGLEDKILYLKFTNGVPMCYFKDTSYGLTITQLAPFNPINHPLYKSPNENE